MSRDANSRESVKVAVRVRPMSKKEIASKFNKIIRIDQERAAVFINTGQDSEVQFTYDFAFPETCSQEEIYENTAAPIVDGVLNGYNGTIFAYGQTGTGKTYTMDGDTEGENRGIVPRAFEHIFDYMRANADTHKFSITMTYVELYTEKIRDLLSNKNDDKGLVIHEDPGKGFYIKDVETRTVNTIKDLFDFQAEGKKRRVVRATQMNEESSRSHSILSLNIETLTTGDGVDGSHVKSARLNLVDLAGSERLTKTGVEGQGKVEMVSINYALMVLGNCISALTSKGHQHIPYRDSALTKLLKDSLGGNAKTLMIATLGPADYNALESASTLRYAERAKKIKNKPRVNMDPKDALLMQYQKELKALQAQLKEGTPEAQAEKNERMIKEMEEKLEKKRRMLAEASHIAAAEKEQLQKKLDERRRKLEKEKEKQSRFAGRLQELTKFLVNGSEKLMEKTQQNEAELAAIREKLQKRAEHQARMEKEIEMKKKRKQEMLEQCKTIQDKVSVVSEKFKETVGEYKSLKAKIPEVQKTIQEEREGLADQLDSLNRQLEMYTLILENFVPQEEVQRIRAAARYNEEEGTWEMPEIDKRARTRQVLSLERPTSAIGCVRPTAKKGRISSQAASDVPDVVLKPTPVASRLKCGPKIVDLEGIDREVEDQFNDDEADLCVDIPEELPGISSASLFVQRR